MAEAQLGEEQDVDDQVADDQVADDRGVDRLRSETQDAQQMELGGVSHSSSGDAADASHSGLQPSPSSAALMVTVAFPEPMQVPRLHPSSDHRACMAECRSILQTAHELARRTRRILAQSRFTSERPAPGGLYSLRCVAHPFR